MTGRNKFDKSNSVIFFSIVQLLILLNFKEIDMIMTKNDGVQ